jgi:hypothetical protein
MKHSSIWQYAKENGKGSFSTFFSVKRALSMLIICSALFSSCGGGGGNNQNGTTGAGTGAGGEKKPANDLQREHLSGNVTSVRQRVYWALEKFGRMDKGKLQNLPAHDFLKLYDKDGFLIEETHYDVNDKIVSNKKIEYGKAHRIDKEEFYKGEALDEYIVYTYDEKSRLVKKEKFDGSGKIKEWNEYIYSPETGLLLDEDLYKANGDLSTKFVHVYDKSLLIEKQKYWGGGTLAQKEHFCYNPSGQLFETSVEKYSNKQASFVSRTRYEDYNSFGDYMLKTEYDEKGEEKSKIYYSYDPYGNLKESIVGVIKITTQTVTTPADEFYEGGDEGYFEPEVYQEQTRTEQQSGNAYTYEYDDHKNWTQKITYKINDSNAPEERTRQFYYERVIGYK